MNRLCSACHMILFIALLCICFALGWFGHESRVHAAADYPTMEKLGDLNWMGHGQIVEIRTQHCEVYVLKEADARYKMAVGRCTN